MKFKRLITMLITIAMVLTLTVPAFADEVSAATKLTSSQVKAITPTGVKAASYSYTKIKVTWNKIEGVDGYKVYRATSKNGTYTNFFTNSSEDKLQVINTGRTTGKTYYYKVRGYKKIGKTTYYTKYSAVTSTYARPSKAVITKVTCPKENCIRIYWNKVSGATGYQIYKRKRGTATWSNCDYKNDKFSWSYSSKNNYAKHMLTSFVPRGDSAYTNWEYKVRAYRTVNGKKVYGQFSAPAEYVADWTIDEIYEELWKYGESLAWTEYEYINADGSMAENGEYIRPRKDGKKYHFKHYIGWNSKPDASGDYCVYTNPANGTIYKDSGFELNTPDNSSWGVQWPARISKYDTKESIIARLKLLIKLELNALHEAGPLYWDPFWDFQTQDYSGFEGFSMYVEENQNSYRVWLLY